MSDRRTRATLVGVDDPGAVDDGGADEGAWPYDERRPDVWTWLQAWYVGRCDGEWEHRYGITIGTLDNPGWSVRIDLVGSTLAGRPYRRREHRRAEDDWCVTWVEADTFHGATGPLNLAEALHQFRVWATG